MLKLFEDISSPLTDLEKGTLVPMLVAQFRQTNKQPITGKNIARWFTVQGYPVTDIRVRRMTHHIRAQNMVSPFVLIATSKGYSLTDDPRVIEAQIESLRGRISSIKEVVDCLFAQKISIERLKRAS